MSIASKLVSNLLIWSVVGGIVIGLIFYFLIPSYYAQWFPAIFGLMALVEVLLVLWVEKLSRQASGQGLVHVYMAISLGKMMFAVGAIALYAFLVNKEVKAFALDFVLVYLLFLILESQTFVKLEKYLKEKKLKK